MHFFSIFGNPPVQFYRRCSGDEESKAYRALTSFFQCFSWCNVDIYASVVHVLALIALSNCVFRFHHARVISNEFVSTQYIYAMLCLVFYVQPDSSVWIVLFPYVLPATISVSSAASEFDSGPRFVW
jgi:hypothetical protein